MINNFSQLSLFVLISLLKQGKQLDRFSFLITTAALFIFISTLFVTNKIILLISFFILLVGVVEKYYAIRISLDRELFKYLIVNCEQLDDTLKQLDKALMSLKLIKDRPNQTRSLESRQQGVLSLLKKQAICCLIQVILLIMIPFIGV